MTRSIFGTDGVRGRANAEPMTPETAMRLAQGAAAHFERGAHRHRVVIGKDTRLSGYMLESAMQAGFTSAGWDVFLLGPVPTPAVAVLTRSLRADVGVMISASHNPYEDNGVKIFGPDGAKLSDAEEATIERLMRAPPPRAAAAAIGRARRVEGDAMRYAEIAKASFPRAQRLDGLRVVVDCANGAAYRTAPAVLWELGAEVIRLGVAPDGVNINDGCGSTHPEACQAAVRAHEADLGLALDGDADRVIIVDETGALADGDQVLALIAERWAALGALRGGAVVSTIMSNLGLERHLAARGLGLVRTQVGDRYVVEAMKAHGCNVGGEPSGHVVLSDYATTGDGLITALQVLAALREEGVPASRLLHRFAPAPQLLRSVRRAPGTDPLAAEPVTAEIARVEASLGREGRLVIRPSGTEPVIRVMAEGDDPAILEAGVGAICAAIERIGASGAAD